MKNEFEQMEKMTRVNSFEVATDAISLFEMFDKKEGNLWVQQKELEKDWVEGKVDLMPYVYKRAELAHQRNLLYQWYATCHEELKPKLMA